MHSDVARFRLELPVVARDSTHTQISRIGRGIETAVHADHVDFSAPLSYERLRGSDRRQIDVSIAGNDTDASRDSCTRYVASGGPGFHSSAHRLDGQITAFRFG